MAAKRAAGSDTARLTEKLTIAVETSLSFTFTFTL
jgi:hypothetical protein